MFTPVRSIALTYATDDLTLPGTWIPETTDLIQDNLPTDNGAVGNNNASYLLCDVKPIRLGHIYVSKEEHWNTIENSVMRYFSTDNVKCEKMKGSLNRNIDMIRRFKINNRNVYQYIEVKKTSGHAIQPPAIIKSSKAQLTALLTNKEKSGFKMIPSLYVLVSADYCRTNRSWVNTYWAMPVIKSDDFIVLSTSKHRTFKPREVDKENHRLV